MKYVATIFVTAVIVFLAVTFYYKGFPFFPSYNKTAVSTQSGVPVTSSEVATPIPTSTPKETTTVKGGGILVFKAYSLEIPAGWTSSTDGSVTGSVDKLTLSSGAYKIIFTQAAMGGGGCTYPGEVDQEMSVKFNAFNLVTTATGEKLRVGVLPSGNRGVCEMQNGNWGDLTQFGHIDIVNPTTPTQVVLDQINSILSSLTKI